jgi:hypothetical protein
MTEETFGDGPDRLRSDILRIWSRLLETSDLSIDDVFLTRGAIHSWRRSSCSNCGR